jgi:hypothetical protein
VAAQGSSGVVAFATDDSGAGVEGITSAGHGVHGRAAAAAGIGVFAENAAGGTALHANGTSSFTGVTLFSRSGSLTVRAGKDSVTKTGIKLTAASLVLATLQQLRAGVYVQAAVTNVAGKSFTVHLSKKVTANTAVAWFVIS